MKTPPFESEHLLLLIFRLSLILQFFTDLGDNTLDQSQLSCVKSNVKLRLKKICSRGKMMSLKIKFFSVFAAAFVLVSGVVIASGQDPVKVGRDGAVKAEKRDGKKMGRHGKFGKRGGGKFGRMGGFRGIELTEDQKAQIKQIREANRPNASVMEEMKSFREARRAGTLTEDQKTRIKALHEQARAQGESVRQQMLTVLTPEQRQQLETRREEMRKRMEERRQNRTERRKAAPTTDSTN